MRVHWLLALVVLGSAAACSGPEAGRADASARSELSEDPLPPDTVHVMAEWPSADGSLVARSVRYEGAVWSMAIGIWEAGTPVTGAPRVAWGPESGADVLFERVAFEDLTGDGLPDLVLLAFTEDDVAYPVLAAWTDDQATLTTWPIGPPGAGLPSATARDAIRIIRSPSGAACAVAVRPEDAGRTAYVYRWVAGELRESPTDRC